MFDGFKHFCGRRVLLKYLPIYEVERNYTLPAVSLSDILHSTQIRMPLAFDFDAFPTPRQQFVE
jgi:hypothetical protein